MQHGGHCGNPWTSIPLHLRCTATAGVGGVGLMFSSQWGDSLGLTNQGLSHDRITKWWHLTVQVEANQHIVLSWHNPAGVVRSTQSLRLSSSGCVSSMGCEWRKWRPPDCHQELPYNYEASPAFRWSWPCGWQSQRNWIHDVIKPVDPTVPKTILLLNFPLISNTFLPV